MNEPVADGFERHLHELERAILAMDRPGARKVLVSLQDALSPTELIEQLVVPVLEKIGQGWECGSLALSQIYMGGRICEELVDLILPAACPARPLQPKMAIAVLEDFHLLGKRLVYSTLRASGFELLDYGRMDVEGLVKQAERDAIELLLISTLMLPSALRVNEVRRGLNAAGRVVKIVVGGAPFRFDDQLWKEVGADATSPTASGAIAIISALAETHGKGGSQP